VRPGWTETLALILLPVGGFVFILGRLAGVVLLWSSAVWSVRNQLIGTLIVRRAAREAQPRFQHD
jgi:hypothetical protein